MMIRGMSTPRVIRTVAFHLHQAHLQVQGITLRITMQAGL